MLGTIQAAIARGRTLGIAYAGKARIVSPIVVEGGIVRCFCLHRREVRSFRLDRITDARIGRPIEAYGPDSLGEPVEIDE
jgi:predicted DNA-binding transcriptional regulator YafY